MSSKDYTDNKLKSLLCDAKGFSKLHTCLEIRLSDHAAQLCGCRSTRQLSDDVLEDIEIKYNELMNLLSENILECFSYLEKDHVYNTKVLDFSDDLLENYLEDTLYYMTVENYTSYFNENFFI